VCSVVTFSRDIHTDISAEGSLNKIFDAEMVAALGRALGDTDSNVRSSVVKFFTAATAQGALHCIQGIFIPKYSQRAL
jgi:hypothetical protein